MDDFLGYIPMYLESFLQACTRHLCLVFMSSMYQYARIQFKRNIIYRRFSDCSVKSGTATIMFSHMTLELSITIQNVPMGMVPTLPAELQIVCVQSRIKQ